MAFRRWRARGIGSALVVAAVLAFAVAPAPAKRVFGTPANDSLRGTAKADRLQGGGGDDRIFGYAGDDVVVGGGGLDRIWAGPGRDRVLARDRTFDRVACGPGRDVAIVDRDDAVLGCETARRPVPPADVPPELSPVVLENRKPGTPGWVQVDLAPARAIEGYTTPSAVPGETLTFHVSADPAADYRILVFRVGYYGGVGARLVACLPSCEGSAHAHTQPVPEAGTQGLVHAGWPAAQRLELPRDWVSGYYLVHFQLASGPHAGRETTTWFVLREAEGVRRAPILVQASPNTWQAYNGWGGGSLYEFNSPGGRRAAKVAYDRPYDQPLEQPLVWEMPLARFLERSGYDVAYQADVDTARDPASFDGRRVVVVSGHGEYWTKSMRDRFEQARADGVDLAFFGANAAYWQIRYEDDFRTIVGYKNRDADPETDPALETDLFRALVPPRYECALLGIQHQGGDLHWPTDGDYVVTAAAAQDRWLQRAGLSEGDVIRGIVSREVDTIPGHQSADDSCGNKLTVLFHRELGGDTLGDADATWYRAASGARVFASGSHQFVWGLEDVPEVGAMRHGLADARLQAFVRAMLDDMLR
jgi:RTX calcium-binding nonapeptide repeat (4 copies)